ncbi:MAG: pentapeptide repeat-containing protein, partial [Dolichospermum sp.]
KLEKIEVVTVNNFGEIIQRQQRIARYFTEDLGNGVTLEMAAIPGGTFLMGSPEDEKERDGNESPQHEVTVPDFFMGKYPVTQAQYQAIMGTNPSYFKGNGSTSLTNQRPVETVRWNDAVKFCELLSQRTGKKYTLPSEAQWEYACRAGTTTPFYFGETITTDLQGANLSSANFPDADFSNANLQSANLTKANFINSNFTKANLTKANLTEGVGSNDKLSCNFKEANFSDAILIKATLKKCNLESTNLTETKFDNANLLGANLQNAIIANTSFLNTNLEYADVTGTKFFLAHLNQQTLTNSSTKGI